MRFFKTILCALFLIAASIAPAAALPNCDKMTKPASASMADVSHCGAKAETQNAQSSNDQNEMNSPQHKDKCCCDGDMGGACKMNCKVVSGPMALLDALTHSHLFVNSFSGTLSTNHAAFVFEIITPPPRSCA